MSLFPRRFTANSSMEEHTGTSLCSTVHCRPINLNDLDRLEQIHRDLPSQLCIYFLFFWYASKFFQNVVNKVDIVSWVAIDRSRPDDHSDELIGFVTAKFVIAKESEIDDLICYDSSRKEETLIYILTLGVVETYTNRGIAMSLISEVIKYASGLSMCRGVYLHVIAHNNPAIRLYKRLMSRCVRMLNGIYLINRQQFDAFFFCLLHQWLSISLLTLRNGNVCCKLYEEWNQTSGIEAEKGGERFETTDLQ